MVTSGVAVGSEVAVGVAVGVGVGVYAGGTGVAGVAVGTGPILPPGLQALMETTRIMMAIEGMRFMIFLIRRSCV
jgi:hypothetical protein